MRCSYRPALLQIEGLDARSAHYNIERIISEVDRLTVHVDQRQITIGTQCIARIHSCSTNLPTKETLCSSMPSITMPLGSRNNKPAGSPMGLATVTATKLLGA